jgi:DNA replication protein DnaC
MIYSTQNVPEQHLKSTFDTFDWGERKALRSHLEEFIAGTREGLVFIGKPGVGKTHLMVATYFALQEKDVLPGSEVIYFDWQMFLTYIKNGFDLKIGMDNAIERVCAVKYLILDDIKPEPQGTFWKQVLESVLECCYNNKTKLMLSTNADNKEELVERWGLTDYHLSRLTALSDTILLKGKDRRTEK